LTTLIDQFATLTNGMFATTIERVCVIATR